MYKEKSFSVINPLQIVTIEHPTVEKEMVYENFLAESLAGHY